jgi:hypothetical protein
LHDCVIRDIMFDEDVDDYSTFYKSTTLVRHKIFCLKRLLFL